MTRRDLPLHHTLLLTAALAVHAAGCTRRATQLVPVVDSDLPASDATCVVVEVAEVSDGPFEPLSSPSVFYLRDGGLPQVRLPFSFGVVPPRGDARARVELRVHALGGCDDPEDLSARTVTRRVRTGFLPEQSLRIPIFLSGSCRGVVCADDQTCDAGACVAVPFVDPGTLTPVTPGAELVDVGPHDAGGPDAGPDPVPANVTPAWAYGSGLEGSFDSADAVFFDEASGDAFISASVEPAGFTLGPRTFSGPGVVLARIGRDSTVRWARQWTIPQGGLALQRIAVAAMATAGTSLFACGSVGEADLAALTDPDSGRTWGSTPRGDPRFDSTDAWVARLDPTTGALLAVSVATLPADARDGDTACSGLVPLPDGNLLAVFRFYNFVTPEPTSILLDGATVTAVGAPPASGVRVALVRLGLGSTSFIPIDARLAVADELSFARAGDSSFLFVTGRPAPSGFLAVEPPPDAMASETAALIRLNPMGEPDRYTPIARTSDSFSSARVVANTDVAYATVSVFDSLADGNFWGEVVGSSRTDYTDPMDPEHILIARIDGPSAAVSPLPEEAIRSTVLGAIDRDGNLYLIAGLGSGARAYGVADPYRPDGIRDAYLASLAPDLSLRWHFVFTEDTAETTFGDSVGRIAVARDGAVLVAGSSSTEGLLFAPAWRAGGAWFGYFDPAP